MDKGELIKRVCEKFCSYYKPEKEKESFCMGFAAVEHLVNEGLELPFSVERRRSAEATEEMLRKKLCASCSYREQDCDFADRRPGSPPCGGFLFLSRIMEDRAVPVDDFLKKF